MIEQNTNNSTRYRKKNRWCSQPQHNKRPTSYARRTSPKCSVLPPSRSGAGGGRATSPNRTGSGRTRLAGHAQPSKTGWHHKHQRRDMVAPRHRKPTFQCQTCGEWAPMREDRWSKTCANCREGTDGNPAPKAPEPTHEIVNQPDNDPHLRPVDDWTEADDETAFAAVLAAAIPGAEPRPTPPVVCADLAGLPLLHAGELTFVYGHPKAGKSWATLAMAKQTVEAGGRVLMICWERAEGTRRRRHRITYHDHTAYHGWAVVPHTDAGAHLDRWIEWLNEAPFGLVVFDSMSSAGVPTDGTNFSEWYWKNVAPFHSPNRALVAIDHSPKRTERDVARGPLGSATKMALADTAYKIAQGVPGKPITDTRLTLEAANEAWPPQKIHLYLKEGIPAVVNADDHTDDQLFHMVHNETLSLNNAANRAVEAGIITSRSTFQRRYNQWLEETQNGPNL